MPPHEIETRIVELARGRLLANSRESKELPGIGVVSVGCLARIIHLAQVNTIRRTVDLPGLMASLDQSRYVDRQRVRRALSDLTLEAPVLLYAKPDSGPVLIDGAQRLNALSQAGQASVKVVVLRWEDVKHFCIGDPVKDPYRTLVLLEPLPIGAVAGRFHDATVVLVETEHEDLKRGGQRLSDKARRLQDTFYYLAATLIDLEYYIYEHHSFRSLYRGAPRSLQREEWLKWFYPLLNRAQFFNAMSYASIANRRRGATARLVAMQSHAGRKHRSEKAWSKLGAAALEAERDETLKACTVTFKALTRSKKWPAAERKLIEDEFGKQLLSRRQIERVILTHTMKEETDSTLNEQLLATAVTGINLARVYFDFTDLDPLFEAYVYAYEFTMFEFALVDPSMIETVIHRRAMAILGQGDGLSGLWQALFDHWASLGIDDVEILRVLSEVDRQYGHYNPTRIGTRGTKAPPEADHSAD